MLDKSSPYCFCVSGISRLYQPPTSSVPFPFHRDFLPSPGLLHHLVPPSEVSGSVRIDTGVRQGDEVTTFYDPMIAKLVVWSEDRRSALKRLVDSLKQYQVRRSDVDSLVRPE